jgi:hypothetical protein
VSRWPARLRSSRSPPVTSPSRHSTPRSRRLRAESRHPAPARHHHGLCHHDQEEALARIGWYEPGPHQQIGTFES